MEISAVRELEGNRTEINYVRKPLFYSPIERHISVPTDKKDEFVAEFSKKYKKNQILSYLAIFAGAFAGNYLGKKAFKNKYLAFASSIVGTFAFAIAGKAIVYKPIAKNYSQFLAKYDVKQVNSNPPAEKK